MQISILRASDANPAPGVSVLSAPEKRYGPLRSLSETEYLDRFREMRVTTDTAGEAIVSYEVFNPGFRLRDTMTGTYYLFQIANGEVEVLRVLMKPGEVTHGKHFVLSVDRIEAPTRK